MFSSCFYKKKTTNKILSKNKNKQKIQQRIISNFQQAKQVIKTKQVKFANINPSPAKIQQENVKNSKNKSLYQQHGDNSQINEQKDFDQFSFNDNADNNCIKMSKTPSYTLTEVTNQLFSTDFNLKSNDFCFDDFSQSDTFEQSMPITSKKNPGTIHTLTQMNNKTFQRLSNDQTMNDDEIQLINRKRLPQTNYKHGLQSQQIDETLKESLEEAYNSFYCKNCQIHEQFTRAIISANTPQLPIKIYEKMSKVQKNSQDFKGYTPIQLLVLKAIKNNQFFVFAKESIYDPDINLECKGPTGWTPLQQALFYRHIPLSTHLFKSGYSKRQQKFQESIDKMSSFLQSIQDFYTQISVKIDSFLPLIGNFTPNDYLKIKKKGNILRLDYTLVGYQFPSCKRRDMSILFDGKMILAINNSKKTYCNLLQPLQHDQMVLMIEDLITAEMKKSEPIVHSIKLCKKLSLFQNQITQQIAHSIAKKYILQLCYTSTTEKRRSQIVVSTQELFFINSYKQFIEKKDVVVIKQKNRNKKVELEVWLSNDFGLHISQLTQILQILGMGNNLINEWAKFLNKGIGRQIEKEGFFPVKIDIPLSYSLYFNIQFLAFQKRSFIEDLKELEGLTRISRKQFQNTVGNKEKRAVFLQAYT